MTPNELDLLMEDVLHEVANPTPTPDLAARIQQRAFANAPAPRPATILQFTQLDRTGGRRMSRTAVTSAMLLNIAAMLVCIIVGASVNHTLDKHKEEIALVVPLKEKAPEPPKPKVPPPPKLPPPPKPVITPEPPKIKLPDVKLPDAPRPVPVAIPKPVPVVIPAPPKLQVAAAAPKALSVTMAAKPASVVNNDPHPAAVALGHPDSPVPFQKSGPAVAAVNMNRGMSGMPPTNSGSGPPASKVSLGNGSPGGAISGTSPVAVAGVKMGCAGCTGTGSGNGNKPQAAQVALGGAPPPPPPATTVQKASAVTTPVVTYKPEAVYSAEARQLHIEGRVAVKVRMAANGVITVLGVTSGLGHGLDEAAVRCAQGIRFKPALDANGNPKDWEGIVYITFQIA